MTAILNHTGFSSPLYPAPNPLRCCLAVVFLTMVDSHSYKAQSPSLIEDKCSFLKTSIAEVSDQLLKRRDQLKDFMSELEEKVCNTQSSIYELELSGDVRGALMSSRRVNLEKEVHYLEREKRSQQVEYWRDVTSLQSELRRLQREYRAVRVGLRCMKQKS